MENPRFQALETVSERDITLSHDIDTYSPPDFFGVRVFNRSVMQQMLPQEIYHNIINAIEGREKIKAEYADAIAMAMKEWAIDQGATHFCHWFQPLTGATAEKHDAFIEWDSKDGVIEKFSGKQLIQGEPDASSFPSGGLRSTFEARGYTGWDPSSPVFVWQAGDGITLCIPSVFFSWTGDVLDSKIPLLRSDRKINDAVLRLLTFTGIKAHNVFSTLGAEQEYFVIDRAMRNLRPDLVLLGRTVIGRLPAKGQELNDHYFGSVKDRVLCYMHDFEARALELGIPVKTRHNEVAPAQHEVAPVFEKASIAIDHNILLMELMRQVAQKHNLSCLLHEKPFKGYNGSGKHCNWSLSTDTGINLLDPTDTPENNLHFLILLTAIVHAVHRHSTLLRASIGSASNDFRLGGHEAPPAIISVYLGTVLDNLLKGIEEKGELPASVASSKYDFGLHVIPDLSKDNTDRNRTSPFAFTGNKFEFRAVGSSASPSMPVTVLNTIVAESLNEIMDRIEQEVGIGTIKNNGALPHAIISVLRPFLEKSKGIRFNGDNYSESWVREAERRGLPNIKKSVHSFKALIEPTTVKAFAGILTEGELRSRYEIMCNAYFVTLNIEAKVIVDLFRTMVLPAAVGQQKEIADALNASRDAGIPSTDMTEQHKLLLRLSQLIQQGIRCADAIDLLRAEAEVASSPEAGAAHCDVVFPKCEELRALCDAIEGLVDDARWALPKYRELLYMV